MFFRVFVAYIWHSNASYRGVLPLNRITMSGGLGFAICEYGIRGIIDFGAGCLAGIGSATDGNKKCASTRQNWTINPAKGSHSRNLLYVPACLRVRGFMSRPMSTTRAVLALSHISKMSKANDIVRDGLTILENLEHRGAVGADPKAGDGVGMLIQIPDAFFRKVLGDTIALPQEGAYGVGMIFLPPEPNARAQIEKMIETTVANEGHRVLGWRDVPVDNGDLGYSIVPTEPVIRQIFCRKRQKRPRPEGI